MVDDQPIQISTERSTADRVYRGVGLSAGSMTLLLMAMIGILLMWRSSDALRSRGLSFFTETRWLPTATGGTFGVAGLLLGTALIAIVALLFAVPIAMGTALFITEFAPRRIQRVLTSVIDVLAAVPSLIYGIWGATVLQGGEVNVARFLATHFAWFPPFHVSTQQGAKLTPVDFAASGFLAGIVVALMILPICTAVMREVFAQAPPGEKEGALALGGTRWGVIRDVVVPFGKGGIIGGSMLGLGRALGETIAVASIISPTFAVHDLLQTLKTGGNSIAALIALRWGEQQNGLTGSALMAAGLVLFAVTLIVNAAASFVVSRSRSGSATEI